MASPTIWTLDRRTFLGHAIALTAAAIAPLPRFLRERGWLDAAHAAEPDLVRDTLNGLVAFIVPGPDEYSVAQGQSTTEPGGLDAGTTDALIATAEGALPTASTLLSTLLNDFAQTINPTASGPFVSHFARLSFAEKGQVFAALEAIPPLSFLMGTVPSLVAFLAYSEVGVLDPATRTLSGTPVGWTLSGYGGVADGHAEFRGYYQGRRRASGRSSLT